MKRYLLILILISAALLRFVYLSGIWNTPVLDVPIIDSEYYHAWAESLATGRSSERDVFFMSPLYPYFLSILYRLFGPNPHVAVFFQALMDILIVYLIYLLGRRLFNSNVGLLAAFFAAFYRPFVYYEGVLLSATLILLLNAGALLLLFSSSKKNWISILAGILLGLSALARPNVLLFALLLILILSFLPLQGGVKRCAFLILGIALILAPIAYRNYRIGGEWVLTTAGTGMNFYAGNNPNAEGIYWEAPFIRSAEPQYENLDYRLEASRRTGKEMGVAAASQYWLGRGVVYIFHHPLDYLILLLRKFFLFFHNTEIPNNLSIYAVERFSPLLRLIPCSFGLLAPFGITFWIMSLKRGEYVLAHLFGLAYLLATLLFFAASEYRLPVLLILLPFAAAGFVELWQHLKSGKWNSAIKYLVLSGLFAVPINMPTAFTNSLTSPRMDFFNLGSVLQKQGRFKEAIPLLERSLVYDPQYAEAHRALGDSYRALGIRPQAAEEFRRAGLDADVELRVLDAEDDFQRGQAQAGNGDFKGAIQSFQEGIALHPDPPASAIYNLAYFYLQEGDTARALDELQKAASVDPKAPRIPFLVGMIYENRSMWDEAQKEFLAALEQNPDYHQARVHAALAALRLGDRTEAARFIEPLIGKVISDRKLSDLVKRIAAEAGYQGSESIRK